jgi:hypothetical protein
MLRHRLLPPAEEEAVAASADHACCPLPDRPWRLVFRTSRIDLVANSSRLASPRSPRERFPLHHLCSIAAREDARLVLLGTKRSNRRSRLHTTLMWSRRWCR